MEHTVVIIALNLLTKFLLWFLRLAFWTIFLFHKWDWSHAMFYPSVTFFIQWINWLQNADRIFLMILQLASWMSSVFAVITMKLDFMSTPILMWHWTQDFGLGLLSTLFGVWTHDSNLRMMSTSRDYFYINWWGNFSCSFLLIYLLNLWSDWQ